MIDKWLIAVMIASIPLISVADWLIFTKYWKCDYCHQVNKEWYSWIVPTFLEIFLFLAGIAVGVVIK